MVMGAVDSWGMDMDFLTRTRRKLKVRTRLRSAGHDLLRQIHICPKKPLFVDFEITDRCSLRCITCTKWRVKNPGPELATQDWKRVITGLREWLGPFDLIFGGGEPFLRGDLLEIISFAHGLEVKTSVVSNGYNIDENLADAILSSGLDCLYISLNGIEPETHDFTRGVRGSYQRAVDALRYLSKRKDDFRLGLATIIMKHNREEITRLVEWVQNEGLSSITFQVLGEKSLFHSFTEDKAVFNPRWYEDNPLWERESGEMARLMDLLIECRKEGGPVDNPIPQMRWMREYLIDPRRVLALDCRVGFSNFTIDPYGKVRLCFNFGSIGNILKSGPRTLWNSREAWFQRKAIEKCEQTCRLMNCNFGP